MWLEGGIPRGWWPRTRRKSKETWTVRGFVGGCQTNGIGRPTFQTSAKQGMTLLQRIPLKFALVGGMINLSIVHPKWRSHTLFGTTTWVPMIELPWSPPPLYSQTSLHWSPKCYGSPFSITHTFFGFDRRLHSEWTSLPDVSTPHTLRQCYTCICTSRLAIRD